MSSNPYNSSGERADAENSASVVHPQPSGGTPFPYYVPIAQFTMRVIGVYMVAVGITYVVQNVVEYLLAWRDSLYSPLSPQLIAVFVGNLLYLVFGLYFVVGGRWVIERVFLPSQSSSIENE